MTNTKSRAIIKMNQVVLVIFAFVYGGEDGDETM